MSEAVAYYNWGRWVTDCPVPGCTDALEVTPGQQQMACKDGHAFTIAWPPAELVGQVVAVLAERPERWRSWFPQDHPLAVATGQPHGQTIDVLRAETQWLNEQANPAPGGRPPLEQVLSDYGFTLADDGATLRRL